MDWMNQVSGLLLPNGTGKLISGSYARCGHHNPGLYGVKHSVDLVNKRMQSQ